MKKESIEAKVEELISPYLEEHKFELVDVEYVKEASEYYLRVYADKEGGITINDCVDISRYLSNLLDQNDFIDNEYRLQVSSPGLDRTLKKEKDFIRYAGRKVELKTYEKIDGQKAFEGELVSGKDNEIVLKIDDEEKTFKKELVSLVKLKVEL